MAEHKATTNDIRHSATAYWEEDAIPRQHPARIQAEERFDQWIAEHDAEVKAPFLALLRDLVDEDDCWFDHGGGCQAHGYISLKPGELCPNAEAKQLLEEAE